MTEKPRFTITIDDEIFEALRKYQYENRINSRAKAAEQLIELALGVVEKGEAAGTTLSSDEAMLLKGFNDALAIGSSRAEDMIYMARQATLEKKDISATSSASKKRKA